MTAAIERGRTRRPVSLDTLTATVEAFDRVGGIAAAIAANKGGRVPGSLWGRVAERDTTRQSTTEGRAHRLVAERYGRGDLVAPLLGATFLAAGVIRSGVQVR